MNTDRLQPYDILLYRGKDFTSRLIQIGTSSPYSHIAIVLDPELAIGIESNVGHQSGVRAIDLRRLNDREVDVYRIRKDMSFDSKKIGLFLTSRLGAKYDYAGIMWLGLLKLVSILTGGKFGKPYKKFQEHKDYFSSELISEAFLLGGLDIVPQCNHAEIVSPGDIACSPVLNKVA